jgi:hypothetical protein
MGELVCPVGTGIKDCKSATLVLKLLLKTPMKLIKHCLLGLLAVTSMCGGAQWFVAPNATTGGNGSKPQPWQLQVALTNGSVIAGDTLWLRDGTYFPTMTNETRFPGEPLWFVSITGTSNNLITLRSYSNEWAKIDRPWAFGEFSGINLRFRDLEFYDSLKGNHPTNYSYGGYYTNGPWTQFNSKNSSGTGNEWINCVVHDVDNCWGYEKSIRGCIIWHVGLNGYEHVNYPVGSEFIGNISAWHMAEVINFTIASGSVISSNIMFGAGRTLGGTWNGDVAATSQYSVLFNYSYNLYPSSVSEQSFTFISALGTSNVIANNVSVSQTPVVIGDTNYASLIFTNNILVANSASAVMTFLNNTNSYKTVDYNSYFSRSNTLAYCDYTASYTFSQWKATTGFDTHSTGANASVPSDSVYVIPNQDQPKRAHIAVYNWSHSDNVIVNLSGVLNGGDTYQLYSAQDYGRGAIQTDSFGGTTISVPMTNLTTAPVLYGTSWGLTNPSAISPEFGAFVVIGSSTNAAHWPPAPPSDLHTIPR